MIISSLILDIGYLLRLSIVNDNVIGLASNNGKLVILVLYHVHDVQALELLAVPLIECNFKEIISSLPFVVQGREVDSVIRSNDKF